MSSVKAALVLTTIFDPKLLDDYLENFRAFGHLEKVTVYVIPDRKTPQAAYDRCHELNKKGLKTICPTLEEQERYLEALGGMKEVIPYNSDNRRNIGYLMAYESDADFVISIDDDNYCRDGEDAFGEHSIVTESANEYRGVNSSTGWFNVCQMLTFEPARTVYHRGFPYSQRHIPAETELISVNGKIHINAGLWLLDPDMDGITWLVGPVKATSLQTESFVLGDEAWSPVNTQNTGLHRDVMPAYYFLPMGFPMAGMAIDRYGDIFSGYFAEKCARHLGHLVRFGTPLADHRRNVHNYLKDATNELGCVWVLEDLLPWLKELTLEGSDYSEAYTSLSYALEEVVEGMEGFIWTDATRGYFHRIAYCMRLWVGACRQLRS